jgi:glutathionyl-hydroquinone reductase
VSNPAFESLPGAMLNFTFEAFADVRTDYYPAELRPEITER